MSEIKKPVKAWTEQVNWLSVAAVEAAEEVYDAIGRGQDSGLAEIIDAKFAGGEAKAKETITQLAKERDEYRRDLDELPRDRKSLTYRRLETENADLREALRELVEAIKDNKKITWLTALGRSGKKKCEESGSRVAKALAAAEALLKEK
jgi:hypothetical protein